MPNERVAIVTGAGSGIGRATALRLVGEGATVVGVDVNEAGLDETGAAADGPGAFHGHVADIRTRDACHDVVDAVVAADGRLDVLCNVAAVIRLQAVTEVSQDDWDFVMAVNASGTFFCCQAAIPHLLETHGAIVNVASNAGTQGVAYLQSYCASKGAVVQITRSLAMELVKSGVRVNAVAPGGTSTPLMEGVASSMSDDMDIKLILRGNAIRGSSEPDDIARVICWLASPDAAAVHGAVVHADQGLTTG